MKEGVISNKANCIDIRYVKDYRDQVGAACVVLKKDFGKQGDERKVDIIFMPEESGAWSVRSVTELMNNLWKWKVSFEDKKESVRLRGRAITCAHCRRSVYGIAKGQRSDKTSSEKRQCYVHSGRLYC